MSNQTIEERVGDSIDRSTADVFLRSEFKHVGSYAQVGKALNALVRDGRLVRVGYGVYVKARPSTLSGRPVPRVHLEVIAAQAFDKLGVAWQLGRAAREYNEGSTQIPAHTVFDTGQRRISRKLKVGAREVFYENAFTTSI